MKGFALMSQEQGIPVDRELFTCRTHMKKVSAKQLSYNKLTLM